MARFSSLVKFTRNAIRKYSSCVHVNEIYILSGVRTPIGCFQGKLSSLNSVQLATKAVAAAVERAAINKDDVQELIMGTCFPTGLGQFPAHQIALCAGLNQSIVSSGVNKLCGSGLKAAMFGCQVITSMTHEVVVVVGVECTSNVPLILRRKNMKFGNLCLHDLLIHDGLNDPFTQLDVTHFVEETAKELKITREDQDDYALMSYARAAKAQEEGVFAAEIIPVVLKLKGGKEEIVCEDEEVKRLNVEKFRKLTPDVGKDGTITAGNASGFNDGAAAIILASGNYVLKNELTPLARIVSYAEACTHPKKFTMAASMAIPRALVKANLTLDRISYWELNETFAVTVLANAKALKLKPEDMNIHGGGISLGHPFGMTGVRLLAHLSHVMNPGELGCAAISHGAGGGTAVIVEKFG